MPSPPRRALVVVSAVAIAAGVVLRFVTVSHLWLDEALTVDIARLPLAELPAALRRDGHPPLYYALLHGWMLVFGQGDVAVRALSALFGIATLPLVWLAGRRLAGRSAAWAATALLAVSPFAIRYSNEARMYSLVMLLVVAGYLLVQRALEDATLARLAPVAAVTGALLLTHYWALWLAGATLLLLAWQWRWGDPERRRGYGRATVAVLAGGILLVPWLPSMAYQSAHTGTPWADPSRPTQILATSIKDIGGGSFAEAELLGLALVLLALLGTFGSQAGRGRIELDAHRLRSAPGRLALVVGATILIGGVVGIGARAAFASRYVSVVVPLFLLLAGAGIALFRGWWRVLVLGGVVAVALLGAARNAGVDRTQAGEAAAAIRAGAAPGDVVVVCPDQLGPSLKRLLPDLTLLTYPDLGDGDRVDWRDYEQRSAAADPAAFLAAVRARAPGPRTVWLVSADSYRTFEGQCPALQALLTAASSGALPVLDAAPDQFFESEAVARFSLR